MPMGELELPGAIAELVAARNKLRDHYGLSRLSFTFDGNLVGDLGEAMAVVWFGVRLSESRSETGIDGIAPNGKTVQVKATGTGRGPLFRLIETRAQHLLFFGFDYEKQTARVLYNGPEHYVTAKLPAQFSGQRQVAMKHVLAADALVHESERLPLSLSLSTTPPSTA